MTTIYAHFDGKAIVPDEPVSLPVGTKLKVSFEPAEAQVEDRATRRRRLFGMFKGQIRMADDFDAPLDEFKDYM